MADSFKLNNYSIICSLNNKTIYFKITDVVSFYQYEGNVDSKELQLNIGLFEAYTIISNCLNNMTDYSCFISVNSEVLKMQFNALIGGFLNMNFEILLREKIMSNDGQLTINFNRLEQRLVSGLQNLEKRCEELETVIESKNKLLLELTDKLSYAHICMCLSGHPLPEHFIPLNIKEITNFVGCQSAQHWRFDLIEKLYQLEKLNISFFRTTNFLVAKLKSNSLKYLHLNIQNESQFSSIEGIQNMPNLESITIINAPALTNIPSVLKLCKSKIKHITIQNCKMVNVVEIQTYCQTNNIKLEVS
jgi:hypothetical protein